MEIGAAAMIAVRTIAGPEPTGGVATAAATGEVAIGVRVIAEPKANYAFTSVACATSIAPPRKPPSQYMR